MSAFTPGPWEAIDAFGRVEIHAEDEMVAVMRMTLLPEDAANARLIAAAPCMLEALQKVDELVGAVECESAADAITVERCHDIIRVALAKATGGDA